jgi:hypothetical protein
MVAVDASLNVHPYADVSGISSYTDGPTVAWPPVRARLARETP